MYSTGHHALIWVLKNSPNQTLLMGKMKKPQEEQQRLDPSSSTNKHAGMLYVLLLLSVCTTKYNTMNAFKKRQSKTVRCYPHLYDSPYRDYRQTLGETSGRKCDAARPYETGLNTFVFKIFVCKFFLKRPIESDAS